MKPSPSDILHNFFLFLYFFYLSSFLLLYIMCRGRIHTLTWLCFILSYGRWSIFCILYMMMHIYMLTYCGCLLDHRNWNYVLPYARKYRPSHVSCYFHQMAFATWFILRFASWMNIIKTLDRSWMKYSIVYSIFYNSKSYKYNNKLIFFKMSLSITCMYYHFHCHEKTFRLSVHKSAFLNDNGYRRWLT